MSSTLAVLASLVVPAVYFGPRLRLPWSLGENGAERVTGAGIALLGFGLLWRLWRAEKTIRRWGTANSASALVVIMVMAAGCVLGWAEITPGVVFSLVPMACVLVFTQQPRWRRLSLIVSLLLFLGQGIIFLGQISGVPLLPDYCLPLPSIAINLALLPLSLAQLIAGGARDWVYQIFLGDLPTQDRLVPIIGQRQRERVLLAVVFITALSIGGGYNYIVFHLRQVQAKEAEELTSIADLKVAQIEVWRNERLVDARALMYQPFLAEALAEDLAARTNLAISRKLETYFLELRRAYSYESITLYDSALKPEILVRSGAHTDTFLSPEIRSAVTAAHDVVVQDLHRGAAGGIFLDIFAPVRSSDGALVGVVRLQVNARTQLFPVVSRLLTTNKTEETLLVRREGLSVVYLNDLRFFPRAALALRFPLGQLELPAAKAVIERRVDLGTGRDYRGVPVLWLARPVGDSPWVMVAKMDQAEVYAPIRNEVWLATGGFIGVLFIVGLLVSNHWKTRQHHYEQQHHETERERHAAVQRLAMVMRHAHDVILLFDDRMRIVDATDAVLAVYGYTPLEIRQLTAKDLRVADEQRTVEYDFNLARTSHGLIFQTIHRRKDGSVFPVEVSTRAVGVEGRHQVMSIVRDITERKRAEDALRESELRYRELYELESDAIVVFELETGRIVMANPAASQYYGHPNEHLLTLRIDDISAEPEMTRSTYLEFSVIERQDLFIPLRLHRRADGTVFPVEISLRGYRREGKLLAVAAIRDITEQQRAREQLEHFNAELEDKVQLRTLEIAERNREIEALLAAIPDMVLRLHQNGTILDFKSAKGATPLASLAAAPNTRAEGDLPEILLKTALATGASALAGSHTASTEVELSLAVGPVHVEIRAAPIGRQEYVVFVRDITDRKRLEAETNVALEREREASEMKTRFISVTSHEFRTPMASAMTSAEMIANHLDRMPPAKRKEMCDRIITSLKRMTKMLDDVLTLNRIDANRTEVSLTSIDLRAFVEHAIEEIRLADREAHPCELHASGDLAHFVTDLNLLHHIVSNLLSNAVRYSPAGKVVTTRIKADANGVLIAVEDHGIGIPEADRARIFEPFERGSNVGNIKGTGLGLNICKRMVALLGGTIHHVPVDGGGSQFILSFLRQNRTDQKT